MVVNFQQLVLVKQKKSSGDIFICQISLSTSYMNLITHVEITGRELILLSGLLSCR